MGNIIRSCVMTLHQIPCLATTCRSLVNGLTNCCWQTGHSTATRLAFFLQWYFQCRCTLKCVANVFWHCAHDNSFGFWVFIPMTLLDKELSEMSDTYFCTHMQPSLLFTHLLCRLLCSNTSFILDLWNTTVSPNARLLLVLYVWILLASGNI
jgi:hypothetical protein